jgi:uncharacterized protein (DUF2147 family)
MKRSIFVFLAFFLSSLCSFSQNSPGDALAGLWLPSSGKARVNIFKKEGKYYGKIVWLREPNNELGKPKMDKNNADESKRALPLLGYLLLKDFTFKGDNTWEDGTIYDPENGSTYSCTIKMIDSNTLDVRGYIGLSVFGRTDTWKRIAIKK